MSTSLDPFGPQSGVSCLSAILVEIKYGPFIHLLKAMKRKIYIKIVDILWLLVH